MRGFALCAALALLVGLASADLQVQTIQEQREPGQTSGTYALVQDGKVVGMVQRYSSSAGPLRLQMGRRAGPSDDDLPPHAERLMDLIQARMDLVSLLQGQLLAMRCPFARQMALLRMQAAAAGEAGPFMGSEAEEFGPFSGPFPRHARTFGEPAVAYEEAGPFMGRESEEFGPFSGPFPRHARTFGEPEPLDGFEVNPPGMSAELPALRGPQPVYMPRHHANGGTGPFRTAAELDAWQQANPAWPRPDLMREGGDGGRSFEELTSDPSFPRPMLWGGEEAMPPFGPSNSEAQAWMSLEQASMMYSPEPEDWRSYDHDDDGTLRWARRIFLALTLACAAVWGAMLLECCAYRRARRTHAERAAFITATDADPKLRPLPHEGALLSSEEPSLKAKEGLEYAAAHVPASAANVTVLPYQPPKASF